jgi:hypothetical protein
VVAAVVVRTAHATRYPAVVIPAKAGIQSVHHIAVEVSAAARATNWILAFARMTDIM